MLKEKETTQLKEMLIEAKEACIQDTAKNLIEKWNHSAELWPADYLDKLKIHQMLREEIEIREASSYSPIT
jgi:hypothetical protein